MEGCFYITTRSHPGQRERAKVVAELAMEAAHAKGNQHLEAYFAYQLAGCLEASEASEVQRWVNLCRFAVSVFERTEESYYLCALALLRLGTALGIIVEWREAALCLRRSIDILNGIGDELWLARACNNLGFVLLQEERWRTHQAQEYITSVSDEKGNICKARVEAGDDVTYSSWTRETLLREAVQFLKKALGLHQRLGNSTDVVHTQVNLSTVTARLADTLKDAWDQQDRNWEEIINLYELSLVAPELYPPWDYPFHPFGIHWALGQAYAIRSNGDQGDNWARSAAHFAKAIAIAGNWQVHADFASLHMLRSDWSSAYRHFQRADELFGPTVSGFPIRG